MEILLEMAKGLGHVFEVSEALYTFSVAGGSRILSG
jgi:hypothetical protein